MKSMAREGKMGPIRLTYCETDSYTEVTFRRLGRSALTERTGSARWFTGKGMGDMKEFDKKGNPSREPSSEGMKGLSKFLRS